MAPIKPIPLRALNEYCFCPRLYYIMYVDGEFESNNDVDKGTEAHEKAEQRSDRISFSEIMPEYELPPKNLFFYSEDLMLVGVLDAIKQKDGEWIPFEAKNSAAPSDKQPQQ